MGIVINKLSQGFWVNIDIVFLKSQFKYLDAKFASLDCRYIGHLRKLPSRIGILNLLVTIFAKHQPYYILISLGPFINSFPVSIINVISFTYI